MKNSHGLSHGGMCDVGQDYRGFYQGGSWTHAWRNLWQEFGFTLRTCARQNTLGYIVHGLLYGLIQKARYHDHLRVMACCLWCKHILSKRHDKSKFAWLTKAHVWSIAMCPHPQVHIARTFVPFKVLYELHRHERFALLFWSSKPPQTIDNYDHITFLK